ALRVRRLGSRGKGRGDGDGDGNGFHASSLQNESCSCAGSAFIRSGSGTRRLPRRRGRCADRRSVETPPASSPGITGIEYTPEAGAADDCARSLPYHPPAAAVALRRTTTMRDRWRRTCGALAFGAALVGGSSPEALAQGAGPERVAGRPNLNGFWQAQGSAHWNLEAHGAAALPGFWQLGAIGAMPAGRSVVRGGTIPYRPEALAQCERNRAE